MKRIIRKIILVAVELFAKQSVKNEPYHTNDKFQRLSYRFVYFVCKHSFNGSFVVTIDRTFAINPRYSLFQKENGIFKQYLFEGVTLKEISTYLMAKLGW